MHCLFGSKSLAPRIPCTVGRTVGYIRATLGCRHSQSCPAFRCDPVESSNNLWKVLWPDGHCLEAFRMVTDVLVSPPSTVAECSTQGGPHVHFAGLPCPCPGYKGGQLYTNSDTHIQSLVLH